MCTQAQVQIASVQRRKKPRGRAFAKRTCFTVMPSLLIRRRAPAPVVQATWFELVINLRLLKRLASRCRSLLAIFVALEMVGCVAPLVAAQLVPCPRGTRGARVRQC